MQLSNILFQYFKSQLDIPFEIDFEKIDFEKIDFEDRIGKPFEEIEDKESIKPEIKIKNLRKIYQSSFLKIQVKKCSNLDNLIEKFSINNQFSFRKIIVS